MNTKKIFIPAIILTAAGALFISAGAVMGGSPMRAMANIGGAVNGSGIPDYFEHSRRNNSENNNNRVPYGYNYGDGSSGDAYGYNYGSGGSDGSYSFGNDEIEDFFREFGMGDDFFDDFFGGSGGGYYEHDDPHGGNRSDEYNGIYY